MGHFTFGAPHGAIIQFAYTVADIEQGMAEYGRRLGVGPWFVLGPFTPAQGIYRGRPNPIRLTLAVAFTGTTMIELIQQHDDLPSVYREVVEKRGHGFHHWAIGSRDFDADVARYRDQGLEIAFSDTSPRGARVVYVDISAEMPGMLEIIEMTPGLEARYTTFQQASVDWDGRDPVRPGI
jgi:hypothetical protein